jgi:hypothetical protein
MSVSPSRKPIRLSRLTPLAGALALTFLSGMTALSAQPTVQPLAAPTLQGRLLASPAGDSAYYTIVFKSPPVTTYAGGAPGLASVPRLPGNSAKLDLESDSARAYVAHLKLEQDNFLAEIQSSFRRPVDVMAKMQHALNAVIVGLTNEEAAQIAQRSDVLVVEREHLVELTTDAGPGFIGAPSIWAGQSGNGIATRGEGILVGIVDSGVNWASPAFAEVSPGDGYVHQNPRGNGNFLGQCAPGGVDVGRCNNKLIGIYNFAAAGTTGTDTGGHGSHTASTTAGNQWSATFANGPFQVSGVAPRANIISYLACPDSCPTTATSMSVNQAVQDGVDVLNYSISGGTSPWTDTTSIAFRNAAAAGMFIAASAGNTRAETPNPQGNVNHLEPWVQTVAASTHDRIIAMRFDLGGANPPASTQGLPLRPGGAPQPTQNLLNVPLIKSPNFANGATDGCSAYPAGTFARPTGETRVFMSGFEEGETAGGTPATLGGVAVIHLDGATSACASGARRNNALAAGAVGVVFVDVGFLNLGAGGTSWSMRRADWDVVEAAMNPASATVSINVSSQGFAGVGDVMGNFSLRGPRAVGGQVMVKPDITAPGVDILASGAAGVVGPNGVYLSNGTSMSSPHMAGAAALLRAMRPTWTPAQLKSALMLSANNFGVTNHDGAPIRPWDYGSGRVNLDAAARVGLIMDETVANYIAANPAAGGDLSTLNLPSIARFNAIGTVQFTRTFRRARAGSQTYTITTNGFPGGALAVTPSQFTVNTSGQVSITVSVDSAQLNSAAWTLGNVTLTPVSGDEPVLNLPVAVYPGGPEIAVDPQSISATSDDPVSRNLTITNTANPTLNWTVVTSGQQPVTPFNVSSVSNGFQAGLYNGFNPVRGYYWSQNFDVTNATRISTLRANGFTLPGATALSAANTSAVTFSVYADNGGLPAGAPEGFGSAPLWTFSGAIGAANGITTTGGALQLNLNAANVVGSPLNLNPGRYWMTVFPTLNGNGAQTADNPLWAWFVSADTPVGNVPRLYAPWANPTELTTGNNLNMLSGLVQGTVQCTLPSWVDVPTTSGSIASGSQVIQVNLDPSSLVAGTYSANLCISSNATTRPVVVVPVTLIVPNGVQTPSVAKAFSPSTIEVDAVSTLTITLTNPAAVASTLNANLVDTLPTGVIVAPTPNASTTCASGTVTAAAGAGTVTLNSGAVIPAASSCTVTVGTTSATPGGYENVIAVGALQTSTGANSAAADATLNVTPAPVLACGTGQAVEAQATAGTFGPTGYATLGAAFAAVNTGTHQGSVVVSVCGDTTEAATAMLEASGSNSSAYTAVTIRPAGGAARTISGAIADGLPMIDLNGADNVTINGLNSGGNSLTLSNTTVGATNGTSTIRFINGASNNTVTNAIILGSSTGGDAVATGTILFGTSTGGANSGNTVSNNVIGPAGSNLPSKAVMALGSAAPNHNSGNTLSGNQIRDFFAATSNTSGIRLADNSDEFTIANNRVFQTAERTFTGAAGVRYSGISITSTTGAFTITGNVIGFANADGTGTTQITGTGTGLGNEVRGIALNRGDALRVSAVTGNTVSGIQQTTNRVGTSASAAFIGVQTASAAGDGPADVTDNQIGSLDGSSSIVVSSAATAATQVMGVFDWNWLPGLDISGNHIGSITINNGGTGTATSFRGILVSATAGNTRTVNNNTIGGSVAGAITNNVVGANSSFAIQIAAASATVTDNLISNISGNGNSAAVNMSGIFMSGSNAANPTVVARNTIHSLRNTVTGGAAGATYVIDLALPTNPGNVVERNLVHSVSVDTSFTGYDLRGMLLRGTVAASMTVRNNMVRLGLAADGSSITAPYQIIGITESANVTASMYFNSVYIGGSDVAAGSGLSYALLSSSTTAGREYQNNIFMNARSNAAPSGAAQQHFAIRVAGTAPNPPGTTSNFNILRVTGTDSAIGVFNLLTVPTLANWQTNTGLDANSLSEDPQFIAADGSAATVDLHIHPTNPTAVEGRGTPIASVADDFDGQSRSGLTPTDIGADAGNFVPTP